MKIYIHIYIKAQYIYCDQLTLSNLLTFSSSHIITIFVYDENINLLSQLITSLQSTLIIYSYIVQYIFRHYFLCTINSVFLTNNSPLPQTPIPQKQPFYFACMSPTFLDFRHRGLQLQLGGRALTWFSDVCKIMQCSSIFRLLQLI